jgi:hypothetical protein
MSISIQWRLMFRVSNRRALDKCLARVLPVFGNGVEIVDCRPYWKVPELWECNFLPLLPVGTAADQVLACLLTARSLASNWYILGSLSSESADGFSGVLDAKGQGGTTGAAVGLERASFDITNRVTAQHDATSNDGGM